MFSYHCGNRFWRWWLRLRRRLKRIVRRIAFIPCMKLWYNSATELVRNRRIVLSISKRMNRRVKRDVIAAWRTYSERSARLNRQADLVHRRVTLLRKHVVIFAWLRRIDNKINREKYMAVQELSETYLLKRCVFHWHKHALISEMCTWKSTKAAVRNWHLTAYIQQKLRKSFMRAEAFHDAYIAQIYLYLWYKKISRRSMLLRRAKKGVRFHLLRAYLVHFRKWKRRMYLVYRARVMLSPEQQSPNKFNLKRSLHRWRRYVYVVFYLFFFVLVKDPQLRTFFGTYLFILCIILITYTPQGYSQQGATQPTQHPAPTPAALAQPHIPTALRSYCLPGSPGPVPQKASAHKGNLSVTGRALYDFL